MDNDLFEQKPHRILIVDDNPSIHEDLCKVLTGSTQSTLNEEANTLFGEDTKEEESNYSMPFSVDSAYQGQEALGLVVNAIDKHERYALAIMDIRMPPGWDGIKTIQQLWKVDRGLQVIICSAHSDYSLDDIISKLGMSDQLVILKKPFDNIEVLQLANALVNKWMLQEESNIIYEKLIKRTDRLEDELNQALARNKVLEEMIEKLKHP